ncbi:MAG: hypothetical protein AAF414_01905 [Pseudomonadota bacterium]
MTFKRLRQERRLIVTPTPQAPAVKRNRYDNVGWFTQISKQTSHESGQNDRSVGSVAVLEP